MTADELSAHVAMLRATPPETWSTRDRILREAGRLIATKGYHGASTRDIAAAVGIRQPSLFNHFANKHAIVEALMEFELTVPTAHAIRIAAERTPAASRLVRYIDWDFEWYATMPIDLCGMKEELLDEPGLERFRDEYEEWKVAIGRIVHDGIATGEFHDVSPGIVISSLVAVSWEIDRRANREHTAAEMTRLCADALEFLLRATLRDTSDLDRVISSARGVAV
ncbi:MAG: TetR/AcrR family transcriptional regulator [Ilumatobacteraceae bacterium]